MAADIDVFVTSNLSIDIDIFKVWLDGLNGILFNNLTSAPVERSARRLVEN